MFVLINTLLLYIPLLALTDRQTDRQTDRETNTLAARGLEEPFTQLCCMLCQFLVLAGNRFWFTYSCTQSTIQLWCCVSFLVAVGSSFWYYIHTQCTIQLCCCVSFLLQREIVLKMRTRFYNKILLGYFIMIHQPMCVFYTT